VNVLVIDDSAVIVALLSDRLEAMGHQVHTASNGALGVDRFRAVNPDLVLMDLEMPVMDGFEATGRIRATEAQQRWAWTPVVFLTASSSDDNLLKAIEVGADDFLPKSASLPVLMAKMHAMQRIAGLRLALQEANLQLERMANCDGLTGLANRRALDHRVDETWATAVADALPYGLLLADLDHFKRYNDRYGHLAGDECLRTIAALFQAACTRANESGIASGAFAARYGGEEFCMAFPSIGYADLELMAEYVLQETRRHAIEHLDNPLTGIVTVSLGLGHAEPAEGRVVQLFRQTDQRLYLAKSDGRNTVSPMRGARDNGTATATFA
jgi:diguanylate cyclase (GGDEF)-like protein